MPPAEPMWAFNLTIEMFLIKRGVPLDVRKRWRSVLGRLAKRRFMQDNHRFEPPKVDERHGSLSLNVYAYREADIPMLDELWDGLKRRNRIAW
jgi:hypothetical protein